MTSAPTQPRVHVQDTVEHKKLLGFVVKGTPVLTAGIIACGCAYIGLTDPETKTIFPTCGFYALTGYYCPGCGMTRALHNALSGDILRAIRFNALLVLALPILIYLYIWWITWAFTGKELPKIRMSKRVTLITIGLIGTFLIVRNFPGSIPEFFSLGR